MKEPTTDSRGLTRRRGKLKFVAMKASHALMLLAVTTTTFAEDPMIGAHRGASKDAPENTLAAFELAWRQGADAIEGDFQLTSDNRVVCIHDADTKSVAKKKLVVADSTLEELRAVYPPIPTLEEVLATVPEGCGAFLEIKCTPAIVPHLFRAIDESGVPTENIVILSFNADVIRAIKTERPELTANWIVSFKRRLLIFKIRPSRDEVMARLEEIGADGLSSSARNVNEAFVKRVIDAGFEHHVWTVDQPDTAKRFVSWGTRSITTNVPAKIRNGLEN